MRDEFKQYIISLYKDIPQEVYERLLSVFCLGLVVFISWKGLKTGLRYSAALLLIEYIFLLFCSTVFFRTTSELRKYDFQPFWSYKAIQEGREDLLAENIMNVVVFVPIGLLFGLAIHGRKIWAALLVGIGLSIGIEVLQLLFTKGLAEVDDVMHNTLGCMIGYVLVKVE